MEFGVWSLEFGILTSAPCPMPHAQCPMPNAPCPMPNHSLIPKFNYEKVFSSGVAGCEILFIQ
ncbi:MAG: hypothetical protein RMY29_030050 [Nostoc sp. CreGUA01]|nr:hypothetical protein [Nostoc sp. CreGUA01]